MLVFSLESFRRVALRCVVSCGMFEHYRRQARRGPCYRSSWHASLLAKIRHAVAQTSFIPCGRPSGHPLFQSLPCSSSLPLAPHRCAARATRYIASLREPGEAHLASEWGWDESQMAARRGEGFLLGISLVRKCALHRVCASASRPSRRPTMCVENFTMRLRPYFLAKGNSSVCLQTLEFHPLRRNHSREGGGGGDELFQDDSPPRWPWDMRSKHSRTPRTCTPWRAF